MDNTPPVTVVVVVVVGVVVTAIVLVLLFIFACRFVRDSAQLNVPSSVAHFGVPSANIRRFHGLSKEEIEGACPLVIYRGPHNLLLDATEQTYQKVENEKSPTVNLNSPPSSFSDTFQNLKKNGVANGMNEEQSELLDVNEGYGFGKYRVPDGICAVCLEEVNIGAQLRMLVCRHAFHDSCITHWLLCANRCPLCNCPAVERNSGEPRALSNMGTENSSVVLSLENDRAESERPAETSAEIRFRSYPVFTELERNTPTTRAGRLWEFIRFGPSA
eukprot:jgi/Galph1/4072/GphlegSOOS_G2751.1